MSVNIKKSVSRLAHAKLVIIDGVEFWTRPEIPDVDPQVSDRIYTVVESDRIDTVSKKYYQQDGLWWVLAHRNRLRLLPNELMVGSSMVIPTPSVVRNKLL